MSSKNIKSTQTRFYKSCESFVSKIYKTHPSIYKSLHGLILRYRRRPSELLEIYRRLIEVISENKSLITEINKLLHSNLKIAFEPESPKFNNNEEIEEIIQGYFKIIQNKDPNKLNMIVERINARQQMNENQNLSKILKEILSSDQDHETAEIYEKFLKTIISYEKRNEGKAEENGRQEEFIEKAQKNKSSHNQKKSIQSNQVNNNGWGYEVAENAVPIAGPAANSFPNQAVTGLSIALKNELHFFESLKELMSKEEYQDLIKLILLYSECVITSYELFLFAKKVIKDQNYLAIFHDLMISRENSRRKNTAYFKPSGEVDFSKCERTTHSYMKLPSYFPPRIISNKEKINSETINTVWVSIAVGSEHYTFTNMRKNVYEEALFKCEDERFEFDININLYKKCRSLLETLLNEENDVKIERILENILKLKVLQNLYGNKLQELLDLVGKKESHKKAIEALIDRVEKKLNDILAVKHGQAKKNWSETAEKNFHKSMDHRSFYFKKQEKKLTAPARFVNEAEFRYNALNDNLTPDQLEQSKENMEKNPEKYQEVLNTFEGITLGYKCDHVFTEDFVYGKEKMSAQPIYKLVFSNEAIIEDTLSFLFFHVNSYHLPHNEKEKVKKLIKNVFLPLFEFNIKNFEYNENQYTEEKIVQIVSKIEHSIFDKNFTYFSKPHIDHKEELNENSDLNNSADKMEEEYLDEDDNNHKNGKKENSEKNDIDDDKMRTESEADSLEGCLNSENPFDEENEIYKEMVYLDEKKKQGPFLPQENDNSVVFYGTKLLYTMLRFFFTLYERFLMAFEMCQYFEKNPKCEILSEEEKKTLAKQRYEIFKFTLLYYIKQKIDVNKYEDLVRGLFGNNAFLFFTIDKILMMTTKSCQSVSNDDLSLKILNLFVNCNQVKRVSKRLREEIYFTRINELALNCIQNPNERNLYRFSYHLMNKILYINYYETSTKYWEKENYQTIEKYFDHTMNEPFNDEFERMNLNPNINPGYLQRNLEKMKKKRRNPNKSYKKSGIEYLTIPNTSKIIGNREYKVDYYVNEDKFSKKLHANVLLLAYQKAKKFKTWYDKTIQSLLK